MGRHRSPTEPSQRGKAAGAVAGDSAMTPMERFKALARKLAKVPRSELDDERRRHEEQKRDRLKP
jgi:hypothetical protein